MRILWTREENESQGHIPMVGYLKSLVFFSIMAQIKAMMTPMSVEPKKTPIKVTMPLMMFSRLISLSKDYL